jgi:GWxTD domain-containing protein
VTIRAIACLLVAMCSAACASGAPGRAPPRAALVGRPLETYRQLGLLAGPPQFPAVASLSTIAGPADSTYVLLGMSLPASALRFQREPAGFHAEYRVTLTVHRDSLEIKRIERREVVRVPSFAETARTDESLVFQHLFALLPGSYTAAFTAQDANSSRGFQTRDTLHVPAYGAAGRQLAPPLIVYEGHGRSSRSQPPDLIINPRRTVAYGGGAPRVYLESYGASAAVPVTISVLDEHGATIWQENALIDEGDASLRRTLVHLPADTLPPGKLWLEVRADAEAALRSPLIVSISDQWVVANFDEVLQFLRYIAPADELEDLAKGSPSERRSGWDAFWARRDPIPATPNNEYREEFFQRARYATEQFAEPGGVAGWRTARGEVYIVLGSPDIAQVLTRDVQPAGAIEVEWIYESLPGGRVSLIFVDRTGIGRFELTSESDIAFQAAAARMRARLIRPR